VLRYASINFEPSTYSVIHLCTHLIEQGRELIVRQWLKGDGEVVRSVLVGKDARNAPANPMAAVVRLDIPVPTCVQMEMQLERKQAKGTG
jgi:hypothetical protein